MGAARQLLRTWLTSSTHSASTGVGFGVTCQRAAASRAASTAQLEPVSRSLQGVTLRDLYKLSKGKLSIIVVATCAAGFVAGSGDVVDFSKLAATCVGTFGCSAAANALNQVYEVRNDGRMRRTMLRPLPAGRLSVAQALMFAAAAGIGGGTLLAQQVWGTCAQLRPSFEQLHGLFVQCHMMWLVASSCDAHLYIVSSFADTVASCR